MERWGCLLIMPTYKAGDPPPTGYLQWHEWARAQIKGGLRQRRCRVCGLWQFPQEGCCGRVPRRKKGA